MQGVGGVGRGGDFWGVCITALKIQRDTLAFIDSGSLFRHQGTTDQNTHGISPSVRTGPHVRTWPDKKIPCPQILTPEIYRKVHVQTTQVLCCCCVPLVRPILLHGDMRWLSNVMLTLCQGRYSGETSHSALQASLESPLISAFIHLFYQTELLSTMKM